MITVVLLGAFGLFGLLNGSQYAAASPLCTTEAECRQLMNDANNQAAGYREIENQLTGEIDTLMEQIEQLQLQIEQSELRIAGVEATIAETLGSIALLEDDIAEKELEIQLGEEELDATNLKISDLSALISERMHATQRSRFTNVWLDLLSQSSDLLSLIRNFSMLTALFEHDARILEHLNDLVAIQEELIARLESQHEALQDDKAELEAHHQVLVREQAALEAEKAAHNALQENLASQQQILSAEREAARQDRLSAQDVANIAADQLRHLEELERQQQSNSGSGTSSSGSGTVANNTISGGGHFIIPLERGRVSCEFGNSCYFGHTGIDLANFGDTSTRVFAAADGIVTRAGWHRAYGNWVVLTHSINGQTFTTLYGHLHQHPFVSVGQFVSQGTVLGTMGNTGNSFGAHLHFEIYIGPMNWPHAVNPRNFINFPSRW